MGSNTFVTLITIFVILLPTIAMAKEFIVGDGVCKTNFDYQAWAKDKVFRVGDTLVFKYNNLPHNVFKVNGTGFKDCTKPSGLEAPLTTGNDIIELKTPRNKWYICTAANHCADLGQKLSITVMAEEPAQAPSSAVRAAGIAFSGYQFFVAAIVAVIAIVA